MFGGNGWVNNLGKVSGGLFVTAILIANLKMMGVLDTIEVPVFTQFPGDQRPKAVLDSFTYSFTYSADGTVEMPVLKTGESLLWRKPTESKWLEFSVKGYEDLEKIEVQVWKQEEGQWTEISKWITVTRK